MRDAGRTAHMGRWRIGRGVLRGGQSMQMASHGRMRGGARPRDMVV